MRVRRHHDFSTLTFAAAVKPVPAAPVPDKPKAAPAATTAANVDPSHQMSVVLERLRKNISNRPKKKKTLLSHIKNGLALDATEAQAARLLDKLIKAGHVAIDDKEGVSYSV